MSETAEGVVILWNENLEEYMADIAEKSQVLSWLHAKSELWYARLQNLVSLPVIVLSSFVGFFSVGSSSMFEGQEKLSSIILGVVSLLTGMLNTIGSYYAFSKKNENHRVAKISYGKLYRWLALELSLPRTSRISAGDLLKMVRQEFERLAETANPIPMSVVQMFQEKYKEEKEKGLSLPNEVNGFEKVEVYIGDLKESVGLRRSESYKTFSPKPPMFRTPGSALPKQPPPSPLGLSIGVEQKAEAEAVVAVAESE